METVVITGGTGMIGRALTDLLISKGFRVVILSRQVHPNKTAGESDGLQYAKWNPLQGNIDHDIFREADHIINLAGAGIGDKRWTRQRKKLIVDSRVKGAELLVKTLREIPNRVRTVVSASGIGWYGPDPEIPNKTPFKEPAASYDDFLGNTCRQWEEAILPAISLGKKLVIIRTGIVLSENGGALPRFRKPLKFGIDPILGKGNQVMSWIHQADLARLYTQAITNDQMNGVYNGVSPEPVSNRAFMKQLMKTEKRTAIRVPVPSWALNLVLGEMSTEALKSTTVSAEKLLDSGFIFKFPDLQSALSDLAG